MYYKKNKKKCLNKLKYAMQKLHRFDYQINLKKYLNLVNRIN